MEERYHETTQNRFYQDMSNLNKNISVEAKLISPPTYITENLSWKAHICSLCHGLSKTYYIIKSFKNILSNHMLWNIYFAYFQSRLRYGIILWGGTSEIIKVLVIQKKVISLITSLKKYESCRQKFKENRILQ